MPLARAATPLFHGLCAFPITPTDDQGRVDPQALTTLLGRLQAASVDSIGLLGSTGTYAYLTREQRRHATETAAETIAGTIPIIVGVGALRTDDAILLAQDAERAGANGLLLAPVSYTPLTDEEVFQHFAAVAGATDLPVCIYNNPGTTHFTFTGDLLSRLAEVPRIVAAKNPAPPPSEAKATVDALRARLPPPFAAGYSVDWHAPHAVLAGGAAWYSVIAGLLPQPSLALLRAAEAGNEAEVRRLDAAFAKLWDLFRQHGSLRVAYAAANLLQLSAAQPPRPILPLGAGEKAQVKEALEGLDQGLRPRTPTGASGPRPAFLK